MGRCENASKTGIMLFLHNIMPIYNCIKTRGRRVDLQRSHKLYVFFQNVTVFPIAVCREVDNA